MAELKVTLPDRGARETMRRRAAAREFLAVADRVAAAGVPPMSEEEIQAEVDAVRRKGRRRRRAAAARR